MKERFVKVIKRRPVVRLGRCKVKERMAAKNTMSVSQMVTEDYLEEVWPTGNKVERRLLSRASKCPGWPLIAH